MPNLYTLTSPQHHLARRNLNFKIIHVEKLVFRVCSNEPLQNLTTDFTYLQQANVVSWAFERRAIGGFPGTGTWQLYLKAESRNHN